MQSAAGVTSGIVKGRQEQRPKGAALVATGASTAAEAQTRAETASIGLNWKRFVPVPRSPPEAAAVEATGEVVGTSTVTAACTGDTTGS